MDQSIPQVNSRSKYPLAKPMDVNKGNAMNEDKHDDNKKEKKKTDKKKTDFRWQEPMTNQINRMVE